jgi:hypothetical protein
MATNTKPNYLKEWIDTQGRGAWTTLVQAIKEKENSNFAPSLLTDYVNGKRIPKFAEARVISEVTGIPLAKLPFKYQHEPKC